MVTLDVLFAKLRFYFITIGMFSLNFLNRYFIFRFAKRTSFITNKTSFQQSPVVIPLSIELALSGVFDKLLQPGFEKLGTPVLVVLYGIYTNTFIQIWQLLEILPQLLFLLQNLQYLPVNDKASFR